MVLTGNGEQTPLSFYEIYQEHKNDRWESLEARTVGTSSFESSDYKSFLARYFGFISASSSSSHARVSLLLESQIGPLTFQGMTQDEEVFTRDPKFFYPAINRTTILFRYLSTTPPGPELLETHQITTSADYVEKMPKFAAVPKFELTLKNNQPNFDHYEYRISNLDGWSSLDEDRLLWDATQEASYIEVRAVNSLGRQGPPTFVEIRYR